MGLDETPHDGDVNVRRATVEDRRLIQGLSQFYVYDFSEMAPAGGYHYRFTDAGLFEPLPGLDGYFADPEQAALVIEASGAAAGFALLNRQSHRGGAIDWSMGEFFVARRHRRQGVAREAVRQVLEDFPGRWEVAVAIYNAPARAFWPAAIAAAPNVSDILRHDEDGAHWRGPVYSFLAASRSQS